MSKHVEEVFIENIVKSLVDNKDAVKIDRKVDELGVLLILSVAPEDISKVIGKDGQTAKAMRTLLRVIGYNQKIKANLKIEIPEELKK